jgi:O-antigen/teichoic acid export membrane protein
MKRFGIGLLYGVGGYLVAALASYVLVLQLSGNKHDREVEAAMTSVFFAGPISGLLSFVTGLIRGRERPKPPPATDVTQ